MNEDASENCWNGVTTYCTGYSGRRKTIFIYLGLVPRLRLCLRFSLVWDFGLLLVYRYMASHMQFSGASMASAVISGI